jgi:hypothetical protein
MHFVFKKDIFFKLARPRCRPPHAAASSGRSAYPVDRSQRHCPAGQAACAVARPRRSTVALAAREPPPPSSLAGRPPAWRYSRPTALPSRRSAHRRLVCRLPPRGPGRQTDPGPPGETATSPANSHSRCCCLLCHPGRSARGKDILR